MANGEVVVLNMDNGNIHIENANVVAYERASDGHVYIIDKVLAPSFMSNTIMDILTSWSSSESATTSTSTSTSTFVALIVTAGLEDLLSHSRAALTVFSPSNHAFAALGDGTLAYLQSIDGAEMLQQIITYHIVSGVYPSVNIPNGNSELRSLFNGNNLSIEKHDNNDDNAFTVNGVLVTVADTLAINGIVHIIPTVLTPPPMIASGLLP
jgi:transforming growth factor-beta-induced protein